jgi:hypothetical protein
MCFAIKAVAGDAGFIPNDRSPGANDAIEQGRLANVGAADDCEDSRLRVVRGSIQGWTGH